MFSLGLVAALLFILLLGLTVLRVLENCPSPNAELLAELLDSLDKEAEDPVRTPAGPHKAKHA